MRTLFKWLLGMEMARTFIPISSEENEIRIETTLPQPKTQSGGLVAPLFNVPFATATTSEICEAGLWKKTFESGDPSPTVLLNQPSVTYFSPNPPTAVPSSLTISNSLLSFVMVNTSITLG